jgi:2,3-dimethylmalate lyase
MNRTSRFRQMIEAPEILVLPGVHDALSLRIAEQAGFLAVTCGGYSATAGWASPTWPS